jgi:major capsid protein E
MGNILDIFDGDAFSVASLSRAVSSISPTFDKLGKLGIFRDEGQSNRVVAVDFDPTTNSLIPSSQWGGPGTANKTGKMVTYAFSLPHYALNDTVMAGDLQSRRQAGTADMTVTAQLILGKKMFEMRRKLEATMEWMRLGVLRGGVVKDGAGTTLQSLYTTLGGTQDSTSFVLGTAATDVIGKISSVKRNIDKALLGEITTGYVAVCSDGFYDAFVSHANVKAAFQYYSVNGQNLQGDYRDGFVFNNVLWINYTDAIAVPDSSGTPQPPIDANSAYLVPTGTEVFRTWYAPADYVETVNTEGQAFYARQEPLRMGKGIEVETQMNGLPVCLKPKVIQKLTVS